MQCFRIKDFSEEKADVTQSWKIHATPHLLPLRSTTILYNDDSELKSRKDKKSEINNSVTA